MFRRALLQTARVSRRGLSQQAGKAVGGGAGLVLGGAVVAGAGLYAWDRLSLQDLVPTLKAATVPKPQPNVASQGKNHALYLWIHLNPGADAKKIAHAVAGLGAIVAKIVPPDLADEEDEVLAGVGFGPEFYSKLGKVAPSKYDYPHRHGAVGDLPSTGGDVFIHAKSNTMSGLYQLAAEVKALLPAESVKEFEDTYSFVYRNGRDLSGFIDGTENRADDEGRHQVAVNSNSGGSFCITQKWIHQHAVIRGEKKGTLEGWVGRAQDDSTELKRKSASSHVARMTSGTGFASPKPVEIVRQSMPFGTVGGKSGLFFIGFAAKPDNFEYMLKRMVGEESDKLCDDVMRLSKCTQGTYWYFPSADELRSL